DPTLDNFDGDAVAIASDYEHQNPAEVARALRAAAEAYAGRLSQVTGDEWNRRGYRSDGREFTVASLTRSEEHTSELQSRFDLVLLHSFPTRRSSDLRSDAGQLRWGRRRHRLRLRTSEPRRGGPRPPCRRRGLRRPPVPGHRRRVEPSRLPLRRSGIHRRLSDAVRTARSPAPPRRRRGLSDVTRVGADHPRFG